MNENIETIREVLICGKHCMPCNMVKQWLADNNIEVEIIYGEDNLDMCRFYGVSRTPTLLVIKQVEGSDYEGNLKYDTPEAIMEYFTNKKK